MNRFFQRFLAPMLLLLVLAACVMPPPLPIPAAGVTPAAQPAATGNLPAAAEYNLGEATIIQERFPAESRFRKMPVRLNGLIAAPAEGGPHPVVVILHGTHPGCPEDTMGLDRWPCDPEVERRNYSGFAYLASALAGQGYVVLVPNTNAEHTFGFGEPVPGERLAQLLDLHLHALVEATAGGANDFGIELAGRADPSRLAFFGHSRGGEAALALANSPALLDAGRGYGPVAGVLQIAGAATAVDPWNGSAVPLATILSACDGDVIGQDGQFFFEGIRLGGQDTWATSAWLERANHNSFNTFLPGDPFGTPDRPDCEPLLDPEAQRTWLVAYATDFLAVLFDRDLEAAARMGLDVLTPAPDELYRLPARVATLAPAADRQALLVPFSAEELTTNLLGGAVAADGVTSHFCPKGFYTPAMLPGSEPCRRVNVTIPGQPSHIVVSWEKPGATLRFAVPEGAGDLSGYAALSLRAAPDPLSPLNAAGSPQAFTVRLTDGAGHTASAQTRPDEPALQFPPGSIEEDAFFEGGIFTGRVPLTTIRLALSNFAGVDLANISEIALLLDQRPNGSLFIGDLEWVR